MKSKSKVFVSILLLAVVALSFAGCNSTEYLFDIKRFSKEYRLRNAEDGIVMYIRIYEKTTMGYDFKVSYNTTEWTEEGYYYFSSEYDPEVSELKDAKILFAKHEIDENLNQCILSQINMVGKNIDIEDNKITFEDTSNSVSFDYENYYHDVSRNCLSIEPKEKINGNTIWVEGYYRSNYKSFLIGSKEKKLELSVSSEVKDSSDKVFECVITFAFEEK